MLPKPVLLFLNGYARTPTSIKFGSLLAALGVVNQKIQMVSTPTTLHLLRALPATVDKFSPQLSTGASTVLWELGRAEVP